VRSAKKCAFALFCRQCGNGGQPRVKNKKIGKNKKSVDAFLAFQLQATLHALDSTIHPLHNQNEKEIHFTISLL
jgi:hypothetical protein